MTAIIKTKKIIAAAALAAMLVVYAGVGFYVAPWLVRTKLPELITEYTSLHSQIQAAHFNPFSFQLGLSGVELTGADGVQLAGFESLEVKINILASIRHLTGVIDNITLLKPIINVQRYADGSINFSKIHFKQAAVAAAAPNQPSQPLRLMLRHLAVENGEVHWLDKITGVQRTESILPVHLSLTDLSTSEPTMAALDFGLQLASGGGLQWQGELGLAPLSLNGRVHLENLQLPKAWQLFLQDFSPLAIVDGSLSLQTEYRLEQQESGLELHLSNGEISVKQFKAAAKDQTDILVDVPSLALGGISADLHKKQLSIATLTSSDAAVKAWLQADGRINYLALLAMPAADAGAAPPAPQSPAQQPWQISLGELALKNYQFQFSDLTRKTPPVMNFSAINFNLRKFGNSQGEKLPVQFSAVFNQQGNLKANGNIGLKPLNADLVLDINGIKLKNFQSYLDSFLNLELVNGSFNSHGNLQLSQADQLQLFFHGDADLADLLTRDKVVNKDFLKWADLQLQQIDIDLAQQNFKLGKVLFDRPYLRLVIQKNHNTNLSDILAVNQPTKTETAAPQNKQPAQPQNQPILSIANIEVKDGQSDFADYSLILPFIAEMNALNGAVDGFSSQQNAILKLRLQGKVYDIAQVDIKGSYQLNTANSDIALSFSHMPLPLITPYMADFAGYKIEKGQMQLDLRYKVVNGDLSAQNKIFIDQLTLGDQVENPHATSLPLHLAIALLKDADGKINLDFPVTGSLDDPQFSVGALIGDVLGNLIKKLVASPFQAFGDLLSADLDYSLVKFAPGKVELADAEAAELDDLSKALQTRPELTLEVKGKAFQIRDWPEMRFEALNDILKKMKSGELRDAGKKIRSEYIELSEDEYKRLLEKFFKEVFPTDIDYSLLGKPRVKTQPEAEFYSLARQKLEAVMLPDAQKLNDLAIARANAISKYMIEKGQVDINRIYILSPEVVQDNTAEVASILSLNAGH